MTDQTLDANNASATDDKGSGLPSAADIMAFDPFGPQGDEALAGAAATTSTPTPADDSGQQSGKTPPAAAQPEPVPAKPAAEVDPNAPPATPATPAAQPQPNLEALTASIVNALETRPAATPTTPETPAEPPAPKYNLGLPPQVLGMLRSEDPQEFANGMHTVINGIANKLHNDMQEQLQQLATGILQRVPDLVQQHHTTTTTQEKVASDFYGKYEHLNVPALKPLIQQLGVKVAEARMAKGLSIAWSDELRDELAEAVHTALPQLRPAAAPQPTVAPAAKAPFATGGGSRPAPSSQPNEFAEVLGF